MIPKKNLFTGSLGKTQNPGGSPFLTTPHTRTYTEPTYALNEAIPGDFVCCSLNGRLWMYHTVNSKGVEQYLVFALAWDAVTGRMGFPVDANGNPDPTCIINIPCLRNTGFRDSVIARGIDWILLGYTILQVRDTAPYILLSYSIMDDSLSGAVGSATDYHFLYSLHRSTIFNRKEQVGGFNIGGGIDPFTHNSYGSDGPVSGPRDGRGRFSSCLGGLGLYPAGIRVMEACYSTLPSVGDWIIIEDFLVRKPSAVLDMTANKYHCIMRQVRPLIPLEFVWHVDEKNDKSESFPAYGTGYSTTRRGIQLAASGGGLWARGLMYLGRAYILPAAFGEDGTPEEFYLCITNSDDCSSPYNQLFEPQLDEADPWMSLSAVNLKDVNGEPDGQVVGFLAEKGDPVAGGVCQEPITGDVLVPNDPDGLSHGTWKPAREEDVCATVFDPMARIGLALGEKGCAFLGGDTVQHDIAPLADYTCAAMADWLAPARRVESALPDAVLSSDDGGMLATNIAGGFDRVRLPECRLPMAWGVYTKDDGETTERVRLSFGERRTYYDDGFGGVQEVGQLTISEMNCPDSVEPPLEHLPWEAVYRNPFNIRVLRAETATTTANNYRAGWFKRRQQGTARQEYIPPCIPIVYRSVVKGRVEFAYVNPDTAELTPETCDFGGVDLRMFPLFDADGFIGAEDVDGHFLRMNKDVPEWLEYGWINLAARYQEAEDDLPGLYFRSAFAWGPSYGQGPLSANERFDYTYPHDPFSVFDETSTHTTVLMRHSMWGNAANRVLTGVFKDTYSAAGQSGSSLYGYGRQFDEYATHVYGCSPVLNYRGQRKYLQNLFILGMRSGDPIPISADAPSLAEGKLGRWSENRLFILRGDLDNTVFDFEAELLKCRHVAPIDPTP